MNNCSERPRGREAQIARALVKARACEIEDLVAWILRIDPVWDADGIGLLLAVLTARDVPALTDIFHQVVRSPRILSAYVKHVRSGVTGRSSLGTRPKKLIQEWLNETASEVLLQGTQGWTPGIGEIICLTHPTPKDTMRANVFAYLTGKPVLVLLSGGKPCVNDRIGTSTSSR